MIIYEHLPIVSRLIQWRGTVLVNTFANTVVVMMITAVVWAIRAGKEDGPDWLPARTLYEAPSPLAWQLLMLPLGFLLGLRSNQAFGRFVTGQECFTKLQRCSTELCRQASSYIKMQDSEGSWTYMNPPAGLSPSECEGLADDYEDEAKQNIIRHVFAFMAAVRQDIRNRRLQATMCGSLFVDVQRSQISIRAN